METPVLNAHNKNEYPPMHTAEHILNQTMIRLFGCKRSRNSHIERKKSKCDYILPVEPTAGQITLIEDTVNEIIDQHLPVKSFYADRNSVPEGIDLSKLPEEVSQTLRIVQIGEYDICACLGEHVDNTAEVGHFKIISTQYQDQTFRIRFKLDFAISG